MPYPGDCPQNIADKRVTGKILQDHGLARELSVVGFFDMDPVLLREISQ